ncbi:hypothetical protein PRNP1_013006 [Phytophthora ramorum]
MLADFPVVWDQFRLDVQMLMRSGVGYSGAVELLDQGQLLHTKFPLDPLLEMLVRMMFWNKLDATPWTKHVPRRYFRAVRAKMLDELPRELYFHKREDLGDEALNALDDWMDFVCGNFRVIWDILHWLTLDRSSDAPPGILKIQTKRTKEQMELLDRREPARVQWSFCSTDAERIAHLPENVRRDLIRADERDPVTDIFS